MACLCAPTSHEGSFRCRLHRSAPNPFSNSAHSSLIHPIRALNPPNSCCNVTSAQICTVNGRESSTSGTISRASDPSDTRVQTAQAAADLQNILRACPLSSSPTGSSSSSSSAAAAASPWSSTSPKSPSHRLLSPSSSSIPLTSQLQTSSASSSSRASASSSSPSPTPSSLCCCTRPPPGKRPPSSYSSASKPPCRLSSQPAPSPRCGASSTTPSPCHAAALAIMKQHSLNKQYGARTYNRNMLSPATAVKIGPSRLSRMAVASTDQEVPLLREEQYMANSPQKQASASDTLPGSFVDSPHPSGIAPFEASRIGLKMRSAATLKFKQSESLCRIVGSKEGSLIMPTVY